MAALGEGQEEREQDRAHEQPVAEHHLDGQRARHRAQDEADRDREHVEDHDVLEAEGVGEVQGEVAERAEEEARAEGPGDARRPAARRMAAATRAARSGSAPLAMRPRALRGVEAVALHVHEVVDEVDGAGQGAEDERRPRPRAATASPSKRCLEKASAARTTRFFVHWWGRSETRRARGRLIGARPGPPRARGRAAGPARHGIAGS